MIQKQSRAGKEHEKAMMTKVQEKEKNDVLKMAKTGNSDKTSQPAATGL